MLLSAARNDSAPEAGGLIKTKMQRGIADCPAADLKLILAMRSSAMIEHEAILHFVTSASREELDAIEASH
jgi:hypothetical protein